jgi:hypothetical protein
VSFDLPDDVLLQDFPLKAAERVFQRLAFLEPYLSQLAPPALTIPIGSPAFAGRPDCSDAAKRDASSRAGKPFSINRCFVILSKFTL